MIRFYRQLGGMLFLFFFLGVWAVPAFAQDATISGTVVDGETLRPIDGAAVFVVGTARGVFTDSQGRYQIQIAAGTYTVRARIIGYEENEQEVTVAAGEALTLDFQLALGGLQTAEIVVTGTRTQRSTLETPVPVDVITQLELRQSPHTELAQVLREIVPSFNASHQTISDGTDHINPASLRGLGPDQVLVLVNGKRRHTSSLVNVNGTFGRGTVGTDLNAIPMSAVQRIEVLRDGAAAQYGSDAISGVINIVLKSGTNDLNGNIAAGGNLAEGDGEQFKADFNYGFDVGDRGFINVSGEWLNRQRTDRSLPYQGSVFFSDREADDAEIASRGLTREDFKMRTGQGNARVGMGLLNSVFGIGEQAEVYAFGGATFRNGDATGFYRRPIQEERVVFEINPNGFLPEIHTEISDLYGTVGVRGRRGAWDLDASLTHGRNSLQFNIENTNNASIGAASPTSFDAGGFRFKQSVGNFDAVRLIDTKGALRSLSLVLGAEFRVENYELVAGQFESFSLGNGGDIPGVDFDTTSTGAPKASGSQVFPGFQPANELNRFRNSFAGYLGFESQINDIFSIDLAGRFENYSDFGSTFVWKAAALAQVAPTFGIRGAVSSGFRAPSLHQFWFNNVSTQFVIDPGTNELVPARVLTSNNRDPVTKAFGVPDLKEETSINASAGLTWRPIRDLSVTGDFYFIRIDDRIVLTSRFSTGNPALGDIVEDILEPFEDQGVSQAQFFANAVDTETYGVDLVANWVTRAGPGVLNLVGSANFTQTTVQNTNVPESMIEVFGTENTEAVAVTLFNREERNRLETALPRVKGGVGGRYNIGRFFSGLRGTYYGSIEYRPTNPDNDETFGAKVVFDADVAYQVLPGVLLQVGANNLFNTLPDMHTKAANISSGNFPFSRRVTQYGMNGGYYYARLQFSLGS